MPSPPAVAVLLAGLTAFGTHVQPQPSASQHPGQEGPAEDLSLVSMDELIARLPPAGFEWRWDWAARNGVEDPSSLEMETRIARGGLTDHQWRAVLLDRRALRFRPRWPVGADYAVSMTVPRWLGVAQIRLRAPDLSLKSVSAGELIVGFSGTGAMMDARDARRGRVLGTLPEGIRHITFEVEVERGKESGLSAMLDDQDGPSPPPGVLWKGTITVPVEQVESWEAAIPPATGQALDDAIRDSVGAGIREWGQENRRYPFALIDPDCLKHPLLATTGLDIRVELMKGDQVLAESWLVASNFDSLNVTTSLSRAPVRFYGSANFDLQAGIDDTSGWMLRLTGESKHVQVLWDAKQRWAGAITIPWSEAVAHEVERVGPAGRGGESSTGYWK
jgi:hypothetical protein